MTSFTELNSTDESMRQRKRITVMQKLLRVLPALGSTTMRLKKLKNMACMQF